MSDTVQTGLSYEQDTASQPASDSDSGKSNLVGREIKSFHFIYELAGRIGRVRRIEQTVPHVITNNMQLRVGSYWTDQFFEELIRYFFASLFLSRMLGIL